MTSVLGVSCYFHDAAAALVVDGNIVAAAEEERFSRVKHDASFPRRAIGFCLRRGDIERPDYVVFYERPLRKLHRVLTTAAATLPRSIPALGRSLRDTFADRLWITGRLSAVAGVPPDRILFVDHHVAHAASAFYTSPFETAALLTIDGVGEWTTAAVGHAGPDGTAVSLDATQSFPHSLGLLYSAFTQYLGFEVNEGEFKVMGLAAYGSPTRRELLDKLVHLHADGSIRLNMRYFEFHRSDRRMFNGAFERLLGHPPRRPESPYRLCEGESRSLHRDDRPYADLAASVQRLCEDVVVAMAAEAVRRGGTTNLCYAGGVALNGSANAAILHRSSVENLFVPPAPGDSGGALGAALYGYHAILGNPRTDPGARAYLGEGFTDHQVRAELLARGVEYTSFDDTDELLSHVTDRILAGNVVGWFQGRFEWGPRALGNRSIVADPRRAQMKATINTKVKYREQFRPFAPSVLAGHTDEVFDDCRVSQTPAEYMLLVLPLHERGAAAMPAASHFGTARVQVVHRLSNPLFYRLVDTFYRRSGVPALLNTSFNVKGEPMVASPADALSTFERSGLDLLVMGNHVVAR